MLQVLLIEDDIIDQLTLSRLIKKNKLACHLTKAVKIEEAKTFMTNKDFDLVICDLNLPDGVAFDLGPHIGKQPFVLLSGHLDNDSVKMAKQHGAIEVLQKSSDLEQLTIIQNLIESISKGNTKVQTPDQAPQAHRNNLFNIQRLLQIFDQNPSEVVNILELFLQENPRKLQELEQAVLAEDRGNIRFVAHKLKSNFNLLGLEDTQQLAQQMVSDSSAAPFFQLKNKFELLKAKTAAIYTEIELALQSPELKD